MERVKMPSKWLILGALAVFLGTAFLAIAINSTVFNYGFHWEYSISHYVGLELWSVIVFALGNCFVTLFMSRYLWLMGKSLAMPRIFYWLIIFLAASLLGLSLFPSGFADVGDTVSLVTQVHVYTSRLMFIIMMIVAGMIAARKRLKKVARICNLLYVFYAWFCMYGFMTEAGWFMPWVMIFETTYILGFMSVLAICDPHRERLSEFYS